MITQVKNIADSTEETGNLPQLDGAWTTKFPLYPGKVSIGSYVVPTGKRALLKGIMVTGDYQGIPRTAGLGAYGLTTMYFTVDGVVKAEWKLNHCGYDLGSAGLGQSDIGLRSSVIDGFKGAMDFTAGQVLRLLSSPIVTAGTVPQILHRITVAFKDSAGKADIQKAFAITTTGVANQEVWSYTIPTGGRNLKLIGCQAMSGDFILGMVRVMLNGLTVMELPLQTNNMNTTPGIIKVLLQGGVYFGEGDRLEFRADPPESLGQVYQMIVWGNEEAIGGAGGSTIFIVEG